MQVAKDLRNTTRVKVLEQILQSGGPISRADISRDTGISAPTVTRVVDELISVGLLNETPVCDNRLGRRPLALTVDARFACTAAILHEGSSLLAGILDLRGELLTTRRARAVFPVSRMLTEQAVQLVEEMLHECGLERMRLAGVGIALPAILSPYEKRIYTAPLIGVSEETDIAPWIDAIAQKLETNVRVENDINMMAFGEHALRGLGKECDMAYVSLGTGIGCGLMLRGELRRGRRNMAGEIGYMRSTSARFSPGAPGELESCIGWEALERYIGRALDEELPPADKERLMAHIVQELTPALANLAVCVDLDRIVLGGDTMSLFGNELAERLSKSLSVMTPLPVSLEFSDCQTAGLIGLGILLRGQYLSRLEEKGLAALPSPNNNRT